MILNEILEIIRPGAEYIVRGGELEWLDQSQIKPTADEIEAGRVELEQRSYQRDRQPLYPSILDFADAFVHLQNGDSAPMDAYVAKCNAIKAQFPKPE